MDSLEKTTRKTQRVIEYVSVGEVMSIESKLISLNILGEKVKKRGGDWIECNGAIVRSGGRSASDK